MAIKQCQTNFWNSRRNMSSLNYSTKPIEEHLPRKVITSNFKKPLVEWNNQGKITVRHHNWTVLRDFIEYVDFKRNKDNIQLMVKSIEYDPKLVDQYFIIGISLMEKKIHSYT